MSTSKAWTRLLERLRQIDQRITDMRISHAYAEVTQAGTAPLRIKFDGAVVSESGTPFTIYEPALGDYVHVLRFGSLALVLGVAGGEKTGTQVINGKRYKLAGSITMTNVPISTAWGALFRSADLISGLPNPPTGWAYTFSMQTPVGVGVMRVSEAGTNFRLWCMLSVAGTPAAPNKMIVMWRLDEL